MIKVLLILGLLASTIMYFGDLLFYFSPRDYNKSEDRQPLNKIMCSTATYKIMAELSTNRIAAGSLLGVFAGFFGAISSFHIYLLICDGYETFGIILSLIWMFSFVIGDVFHSHWFYLSLINEVEEKTFDVMKNFVELLRKITYVAYTIGNGLLLLAVVFQIINIPIYMLIFTPAILFYSLILLRKLPQPYYLLVVGGWGNIPFIIYYGSLLLFVV